METALIIISVAAILVAGIIGFVAWRKIHYLEAQQHVKPQHHDPKDLYDKLEKYQQELTNQKLQYENQLHQKDLEYQQKIHDQELVYQDKLHLINAEDDLLERKQRLENELVDLIKRKESMMLDYDNSLNERRQQYDQQIELYSGAQLSYNKLVADLKALEDRKTVCQQELDAVVAELEEMREQHKAVILQSSDDIRDSWWELKLGGREEYLVGVLRKLKDEYAELKKEISDLEWRKVWLPKVQNLTNEMGLKRSGIYRLVLKSDESKCYVGKATDVHERWYQHIKKMIGAESVGNEKLYQYKPEDFWWSVIEWVDSNKLGEREKYWIEFWGSKEKGLNRIL